MSSVEFHGNGFGEVPGFLGGPLPEVERQRAYDQVTAKRVVKGLGHSLLTLKQVFFEAPKPISRHGNHFVGGRRPVPIVQGEDFESGNGVKSSQEADVVASHVNSAPLSSAVVNEDGSPEVWEDGTSDDAWKAPQGGEVLVEH